MAASVVIIEEQYGRRRRVELAGGALPLQGASWGGTQLMTTTWNPGNSEATQHVLGPQEVPSDWDFVWNTTRIIRTPVNVTDTQGGGEYQIVQADALAALLRDIFRGGTLLKVSWISKASNSDAPSPRQVRLGRAESWDFSFARPDDIDASISFAWIGESSGQPKASDLRGADLGASLQKAILACDAAAARIANDTIRAAQPGQPGPTRFTLGQLESIANGPLELVDSFARAANGISSKLRAIGEIINTVKETPAAILGRIVDVANNGVAVANQFVDELTREGPETQSTRNKLSILSKNSSYFSGAQDGAAGMADILEKVAEAARRRRNRIVADAGESRGQDKMRVDDAFKVHIPRTGDTMMTIASKYYGNPDLADELATANGLPAYTIVPPRMPIIVPTRRNLEEANRNRV